MVVLLRAIAALMRGNGKNVFLTESYQNGTVLSPTQPEGISDVLASCALAAQFVCERSAMAFVGKLLRSKECAH